MAQPTTAEPSREEMMALYAECTTFIGSKRRSGESMVALIGGAPEMDSYGAGGVVEELEGEVAALLGKEAAVFFPTGTMAQQIALRVHADARGRRGIVMHPKCHLDTHEERGYELLHGLHAIQACSAELLLTAQSLQSIHEPAAALLVELPQRDIGGVLPTWADLQEQVQWARQRNIAAHMDGARLWEAAPYYAASAGVDHAQIAALFDTVYVSFYKGLGGIAGAVVAGPTELVEQMKVWRIRHGGRMYGMWPYAAAALNALKLRLPLMPSFYERAVAIGHALAGIPGLEVMPNPVQSPMMHIRIWGSTAVVMSRMRDLARDERVWMFGGPFASDGPGLQRFEYNVGEGTMELTVEQVAGYFSRIAGAE